MKNKLIEAKKCYQDLSTENPEAIKAFTKFTQVCEKDGALSSKMKQIIMVSLSVLKQCDWCISYHVKKALDYGASKDELIEACFIVSLMGGGPAMMQSQIVLKAIKEFSLK